MAKEIERKFLIHPDLLPPLEGGKRISQGYVRTDGKSVVRARIKGEEAFLTLKGEVKGFTCSEFEYKIPTADAAQIIEELCRGNTVDKMRYEIIHGQHTWEVDVFEGRNKGLIVAEVELQSEKEKVTLPEWIAEEVTGQIKYFNVAL